MSPEQQQALARLMAEVTGQSHRLLSEIHRCSGGCIHHAYLATFDDAQRVFVKFNRDASDMLSKEAAGLAALERAGVLRVPKLLATGELGGGCYCLVLEAIEPGRQRQDFWEELGRSFAGLHRHTAECFGFEHDNFIGSSKQPNRFEPNWVRFFAEQRLGFQLRMVRQRSLGVRELYKRMEQLLARLDKLLGDSALQPSLLHGDLWTGNFLVDEKGGPVVIDPAVYYGAREADLAMPLLFGGFPDSFYRAYDEAWPLADGWRDRVAIYQLYHLLNHLNLFGSGYLDSCLEIARRFG